MPNDKISPQEHAEIIATNPLGYFTALHHTGMDKFSAMLQSTLGNAAETLTAGFQATMAVLKLHSEELSIFRAIEVDIRNENITQEKLVEYLGKLSAFRERVQAEQKALNETSKSTT